MAIGILVGDTLAVADRHWSKFGIHNLSVRAIDRDGMMPDAEVIEGDETAHIHVHNAARGCFNATVERA